MLIGIEFTIMSYLKEALLDMAGVTTPELGGAPPNKHFLKSSYDTCVDQQAAKGAAGKQNVKAPRLRHKGRGYHNTTKHQNTNRDRRVTPGPPKAIIPFIVDRPKRDRYSVIACRLSLFEGVT